MGKNNQNRQENRVENGEDQTNVDQAKLENQENLTEEQRASLARAEVDKEGIEIKTPVEKTEDGRVIEGAAEANVTDKDLADDAEQQRLNEEAANADKLDAENKTGERKARVEASTQIIGSTSGVVDVSLQGRTQAGMIEPQPAASERGLMKSISEHSVRLQHMTRSPDEHFAVHKVEMLLGELRGALPRAAEVLSKRDPDLSRHLMALSESL